MELDLGTESWVRTVLISRFIFITPHHTIALFSVWPLHSPRHPPQAIIHIRLCVFYIYSCYLFELCVCGCVAVCVCVYLRCVKGIGIYRNGQTTNYSQGQTQPTAWFCKWHLVRSQPYPLICIMSMGLLSVSWDSVDYCKRVSGSQLLDPLWKKFAAPWARLFTAFLNISKRTKLSILSSVPLGSCVRISPGCTLRAGTMGSHLLSLPAGSPAWPRPASHTTPSGAQLLAFARVRDVLWILILVQVCILDF